MIPLTFAANNGAIGGGEVMLLRMAEAARDTGLDVTVVGPKSPNELVQTADEAGFATVAIAGGSRAAYMRGLRTWDRHHRTGHLWCNGLVPAVATAGRPRRVVHLHQLPLGALRPAAALARLGAIRVVVPSTYLAGRVRDAWALPNWTTDIAPRAERDHPSHDGPVRIGFLGRLSQDKGVDTLARAIGAINARKPGTAELWVAGDYRFVPPAQQAAVRRSLAELGDDVTELGWMNNETFFAAVDVAVFPSRWEEPFGLVAAEAMGARVPVVVSDAGALPEVVGPAHPWVARASDSTDLARVIEEALTADPRRAVDGGRIRWEAEYSPHAGRKRLAVVLHDLGILPAPEGG